MGYQEKTHVVAIVRLVSRHRVLLLCPYLHTCTWMDTYRTVDDGVGENTYTLCTLPDM